MLLEDHSASMTPTVRDYAQIIFASATRMGLLIDDLLAFCRFSRQPLQKRPVNISDLADQVIRELRRAQGDRRVEVRVAPLPESEADPALLRQVLVNLLSNAFKFTRGRDPAVIEIGCRQEGMEHVYFVRDNGAGFDMMFADKLFGVFQRLHSANAFEGTGVGLSIAQRIIQRHGGRIWAEAGVDKGATFHFTLGAAPPPP
jgi:light-regulated signal transduction histidine kinase (bacteriophytochrome)